MAIIGNKKDIIIRHFRASSVEDHSRWFLDCCRGLDNKPVLSSSLLKSYKNPHRSERFYLLRNRFERVKPSDSLHYFNGPYIPGISIIEASAASAPANYLKVSPGLSP
ncbi:hypothetical protein M569_00075 [Genlisea aurea]|uniref:Uncharacterized protein n=1 Tax=Genlisea aurea TaxID=192259 RepID=S8D5J7_9LAMI|nr:hypothetical protein M569_00075 [Genlisea aurea]